MLRFQQLNLFGAVMNVRFIDHLHHDLRYAGRMIRRAPAFTAIAVLSLALGIGANTAVFSLTDAVLLKTLSVASPRELVLLESVDGRGQFDRSYDGMHTRDPHTGLRVGTSFSMPAFERLRIGTSELSALFAFAPLEQLNVVAGGRADIARGQLVTGTYYSGLGVRAIRGRTIVPEDDRQAAAPVAVITYDYWQRRFGGDPAIVGSHIDVDGFAATIIGVTPPDFRGTLDVGDSPDVTLPMSAVTLVQPGADDLTNVKRWWVRIMGRRRAGVTEQRVQSELGPAFHQTAMAWALASSSASKIKPGDLPTLRVVSGSRGLEGERNNYRAPLTLLTIVAGLILLIACANVANLLLTRATTRQHEITVRLALGASRARIVKQLLVESLVLVVGAESFGLLLAYWSKNLLVALRPSTSDAHLTIDLRVLAVATVLSAATAVLFGLAPALRATRLDVAAGLKDAARTVGATSRAIAGRVLVVAQIAMSVVLLIDAALFIRTLRNLRGVEVGFNQEQLLLFRVDPRLSGYRDAMIPLLYRRLQTQLGNIPSVRSATFSRHPQLSNSGRMSGVSIVGSPNADEMEIPINLVGPNFFETMQLPIAVGRPFTAQDDEKAPRVAIINESFARKLFPNDQPVGRRVKYNGELEIVGVARDAKYYSIRKAAEPILYVPYLQHDQGQANFTLRTAGDPLAIVASVREAVHATDKTLSIFDVRSQRAALDATLSEERLFAKLSAAFGALALLLASIGVYGVVSYATARRTAEIGIRIALGAGERSILWLVARRTVALVALGTVIGLVAGVEGARLFTRRLYGITPADPASIMTAAGLIAGVALLAAFVPANRARRVSPLVALRQQ
jgi:predicted permease